MHTALNVLEGANPLDTFPAVYLGAGFYSCVVLGFLFLMDDGLHRVDPDSRFLVPKVWTNPATGAFMKRLRFASALGVTTLLFAMVWIQTAGLISAGIFSAYIASKMGFLVFFLMTFSVMIIGLVLFIRWRLMNANALHVPPIYAKLVEQWRSRRAE